MRLLNLGCGNNFHKDWINIDFNKTDECVITHNLFEGMPCPDLFFDVLYHSHVLEDFNKEESKSFICECFRVLKADGIRRIAVPDLETIAKEYLSNLNRAVNHKNNAEFNYEWVILEMYDQTVRKASGGEMAKYFYRKEIPNKE
jgi:predicted SAM-dependent methyltransferase